MLHWQWVEILCYGVHVHGPAIEILGEMRVVYRPALPHMRVVAWEPLDATVVAAMVRERVSTQTFIHINRPRPVESFHNRGVELLHLGFWSSLVHLIHSLVVKILMIALRKFIATGPNCTVLRWEFPVILPSMAFTA
jgi:hypothetical protein